MVEHRRNKEGTMQLISFFGAHGWRAIASPARLTERSDKGTTAGVIAAIKNHVDSL